MNACPNCLQPVTDVTGCRPCRAARAARWYSENASLASAQRGLRTRLARKLGVDGLALIDRQLDREQAVCACCRIDRPVTAAWSLDDQTDDGVPLLRDGICRSCKIAVNRYLHPSRYRLQPVQLDAIETYLRRPLSDPRAILRRAGRHVEPAGQPVAPGRPIRDTGGGVLDWLASIGAVA